jgi:acyl carrier protein
MHGFVHATSQRTCHQSVKYQGEGVLMQVEAIIQRFIESKKREKGQLSFADNGSLIEGGILDSLGLVQLIMLIEEKFGVTVQPCEVIPANFETLHSIQAFVKGKL